jgi:hypothetical protein
VGNFDPTQNGNRGLQLSRTVTLGELVAVLLMIGSLMVFYAKLSAQMAVMDDRVTVLWHWAGF